MDQELFLAPAYFPFDPSIPDGGYSWDDMETTITVKDALWSTICVSSNVSAMALLSLTTTEDLNTLAQELGLQDTLFNRQLAELPDWQQAAGQSPMPDQFSQAVSLIETEALSWTVNLTTPANMAKFLQLLLDGEVVSGVVSNQLLELLFDQQIIDRIPALLPDDVQVAHKTGNLIGIVHDVGVIMTDDGPVILVAMSEGVPDEEHATMVIQTIAAFVFRDLADPSAFA
jgi:beta-lactamase class A